MRRITQISIRCLLIVMLLLSFPTTNNVTYIVANAAITSPKPTVAVTKKTLYAGYNTYTMTIKNLIKSSTITYTCSNKNVAKVSKTGKITPIIKGTATITATVRQSGETYTLNVLINVKNPSIKLTSTASVLNIGDKFTFEADVYGMEKKIVWSVSDNKIATINSSTGILTAKVAGKVTVTAKAGGKTNYCTVIIEAKELSAKEIYAKCVASTVEILTTLSNGSSLGSGFFIGNGIVVTNYHVIDGAKRIEITTNNNIKYTVNSVLGYDKNIDLAILSISSENNGLVLNLADISAGDTIYTIGSPYGLTGTFSTGIVSTNSRVIKGVDYIQHTAPISKGNSGGPLLNTYGEVMGINTMTLEESQNLNFAINISAINKINTNSPITADEFYLN